MAAFFRRYSGELYCQTNRPRKCLNKAAVRFFPPGEENKYGKLLCVKCYEKERRRLKSMANHRNYLQRLKWMRRKKMNKND